MAKDKCLVCGEERAKCHVTRESCFNAARIALERGKRIEELEAGLKALEIKLHEYHTSDEIEDVLGDLF